MDCVNGCVHGCACARPVYVVSRPAVVSHVISRPAVVYESVRIPVRHHTIVERVPYSTVIETLPSDVVYYRF
jgi:hypothetical protein